MKKTWLIPITLTALTPMVSLVGCSQTKSFNLDLFKTITYNDWDFPVLTIENSVNLQANTSYKAKIDTKKLEAEITDKNFWKFSVSQFVLTDECIDAQISKASVKIDNKPLEFAGTHDEPPIRLDANQFAIFQNEGVSEVYGGIGAVDNNTIVEINFEIKEPVSGFYPTFYLSSLID